MAKISKKVAENAVQQAFKARCTYIQIPTRELPKIWDAGMDLYDGGFRDDKLADALRLFVDVLLKKAA